ncbi:mannose-6-phosphate isomerase, class I [Corynebacterium sp. UBA2622]|uniref:mannose-6-phosphate isomerase, class I n=1 Tax=Corynebacterium sp. UBA2622 TaxID=1946393 RepID=UPI0025BBE701|nr:mannose-6-phosphate isomerase, class I [Corynebacterium sp. UBA2622]
MKQLDGTLRTYPWGSRSLLAQLRGEPVPSQKPEAELWFGAHAAAPSTVGGTGLDKLIAADPAAELGERVRAQFDGKLPFLLKLLAADEPLSIQAHPSREQAREGFERENAEGIAVDSPRRNYRDANHKPELIVALTEFHALAGFSPLERTTELFQALSCPALDRYAAMIDPDNEAGSLRALFTTWISIPTARREELIARVAESARGIGADSGWLGRTARNFLSLAEQYPGDSGTLASLMLNHVELSPGEALFLAAGQPHAYLRGMGVEIMANSDNVLRGGLTSKHVDVPELVRILRFESFADPSAVTTPDAGATRYEAPCDDFLLTRYELGAGENLDVALDGPAIALCTAGSAAGEGVELTPGRAAWVPASDGRVTLAAGERGAEIFLARA